MNDKDDQPEQMPASPVEVAEIPAPTPIPSQKRSRRTVLIIGGIVLAGLGALAALYIAAFRPMSSRSYFDRGVANYQQGNLDQAIADLDQAIALQPDDADAYNNRGIAYADKGDYDRAIA